MQTAEAAAFLIIGGWGSIKTKAAYSKSLTLLANGYFFQQHKATFHKLSVTNFVSLIRGTLLQSEGSLGASLIHPGQSTLRQVFHNIFPIFSVHDFFFQFN